jgi:hypothetical protein
MLRKAMLLSIGLVIGGSGMGAAQDSGKLALLIPTLFGPNGLKVDSEALLPDGSTHSAHFNSDFQAEFTQFNIALASQLAAIPLPTPASGFTYTFDSSLGIFQRSTQSFGPILTERAETIGKGKFTFGVTYQYFSFDSIEGIPLDSVPAVFTHDSAQLGGGRSDVVTTSNSIAASVNQSVAFLSYGLGSHLDLSLAIPFVTVDLAVTSHATIVRVGTASSPATHYFDDGSAACSLADISSASPTQCTTRQFASAGHASGIGDLVFRLKGAPLRGESFSLALGVDVRVPTGDAENFLGLGAMGVKPFLAASLSQGRVAPHVNVSYQWNGKSVLAGDVQTGEKAELPDQVNYAVGVDIGATKRLTLAFDFLGTYVIDSPRLIQEVFTAANGQPFAQIGFVTQSYNIANGAAGLKFNPAGRLLIDLNVLFKLDNSGLRDSLTPLVGIEYAF